MVGGGGWWWMVVVDGGGGWWVGGGWWSGGVVVWCGWCGGLCGGWWVIWGDKQPSNSQPIEFLELAWPCKCGLMLAELALDSINTTSLNRA